MASWTNLPLQQTIQRDDASKLNTIVVGAGLGGLGAAIAILLGGHDVTVLEAASEIGEVGAGIQVLPNSARVLASWGVLDSLEPFATKPSRCNFIGWQGNHLSQMNYHAYAAASGAPFWDFYRMNLHKCLLDRAVELGAKVVTHARVTSLHISESADSSIATVSTADGREFSADLVVGADGINSKLREEFLGREDPPTPTGDLAYRLLLDVDRMRQDPDLREFIQEPQVNYWVGPGKHAVNYVLRGTAATSDLYSEEQGLLFNMVLLVPDDLPAGANTLEGNIEEMRAHFADWDPRIPKLLSLCDSVLKWRLMIRPGLEPTWSHPSGAFTMLGDAVHATLPYLASGAGMALEDAGVLGLCLGRIKHRDDKKKALQVYEACRRERTEEVVRRGTYNQWIYHLEDGKEQQERDQLFKKFEETDKEWLAGKNPTLPVSQETGDDPFPWRYHGVARWLLTYDMWKDVEAKWALT
ncbi:FAD binding domain-containing protein [Coniella lustricola]|uniref:FAD binding domain-containing protein n=1 Tax=Coniella lustricola TaxID=2025994 RepID=A0A2T3A4D0_9PEZI|nr:FAD binding domain-containing protein [Coniella lustricola]